MEITFIGCGDSFSDLLGNNSALIEFNETNLLIDIPDSNYSRMKYINKDYGDIDNLFITHLHGDHINGLERFAYYRKYVTPNLQKPNLYVPEVLYHGLWDSVKNGLGITIEGIKTLEDYFTVFKVKSKFEINGVSFQLIPSKHVPNMPTYGLFVEKEFYYTSDSVYGVYVRNYLNQVKKVFHDMHFFDFPIAVHASVKDFEWLSLKERLKLYAMHYDDSKKESVQIEGIKLVKPFVKMEI